MKRAPVPQVRPVARHQRNSAPGSNYLNCHADLGKVYGTAGRIFIYRVDAAAVKFNEEVRNGLLHMCLSFGIRAWQKHRVDVKTISY